MISVNEYNAEIIGIDLHVPSKHRLICIYRSPGSSSEVATEICKSITCLSQISWPITVVGDFNLPLINWHLMTWNNSETYNVFMNSMQILGLTQLVLSPTRNDNILDLVLTSAPLNVSNVTVGEFFSDHRSVDFNIVGNCTDAHHTRNPIPVYNFKNADFVSMRQYLLNVNWGILLNSCFSVESKWDVFCNVLNQACELYVPKYLPKKWKIYLPYSYNTAFK